MNNRFHFMQLLWKWSAVSAAVLFIFLGLLQLTSINFIGSPSPSENSLVADQALNLLQAPEAAIKPTDSQQIQKFYVYARHSDQSSILTSVDSTTPLQIVSRKKGWLQISLPQGVPVWVAKSALQRQPGGSVIVARDLAFAYSNPLSSLNDVTGVVYKGDELRRIRTHGDWVRMWSPERFSAWIKEADLGFTSYFSAT